MTQPSKKFSGSLPHWIADYNSLNFYNAGAPINWAAFADAKYGQAGRRRLPSGLVVHLNAGKIEPGAGAANATYLLFADVAEDLNALGVSGHGLVTGGNVREAFLPDASGSPRALDAGLKTALGLRFHFQSQ